MNSSSSYKTSCTAILPLIKAEILYWWWIHATQSQLPQSSHIKTSRMLKSLHILHLSVMQLIWLLILLLILLRAIQITLLIYIKTCILNQTVKSFSALSVCSSIAISSKLRPHSMRLFITTKRHFILSLKLLQEI